MLCLLDASKVDDALALVTDLSDSLEDRTLEVILHEATSKTAGRGSFFAFSVLANPNPNLQTKVNEHNPGPQGFGVVKFA